MPSLVNYQKFRRIYSAFKSSLAHGIPLDSIGRGLNHEFLDEALEKAKFFEVDSDTVKMLEMTALPDIDIEEKLRIPFETIFIDADIGFAKGIMVTQLEEDWKVTITEETLSEVEKTKKDIIRMGGKVPKRDYKIGNTIVIKNPFRIWFLHDHSSKCKLCPKKQDKDVYIMNSMIGTEQFMQNTKLATEVKNFIFKFMFLLHEPDIEIIEIHRGKKNKERAIKKGKIPLPSSNVVTLTNKLRHYVDELKGTGKFQYGYQFWVRGHFRRYYDRKKWTRLYLLTDEQLRNHSYGKDKYGNITKWIKPYIKGAGILFEKKYKVRKKEDALKVKFEVN